MMDSRIGEWIREIERFNPRLHLMGPAMLQGLEGELQVMIPLLEVIDEPEVADLGSGSGLPAIPFKILHPGTRVVLIERSAGKSTFLRHVVQALGLDGAEVLALDPLRAPAGPFDAVLARSFSPLESLEQVCLKILRDQGRLYYLFTGDLPRLGECFRLDRTTSQASVTHQLSLAVFTRLPG
jgi:16S rRNA G527 N7-methylase RsmG